MELVRAGAAVELVHTASLIHDDVIDSSQTRRGKQTVFAQDGADVASAAGDLTFSRAVAEVAENGSAEQVKVLAMASRSLARGELTQRANSFNFRLNEEEYMSAVYDKTASLFEAACDLGALAGHLSPARRELSGFGRKVGLAFQIVDDVLDIVGEDSVTGKSCGTDLKDGAITLPYIMAREEIPELKQLEPDLARGSQVDTALELIAASTAPKHCREVAESLAESALDALEDHAIPEATRNALEAIAGAAVERGS